MAVSNAYRNPRGVEVDDLKQAGFLALIEAVKTFEAGRAKFLTWYVYYLRRAFNEAQGLRGRRSDLLDRCPISLDGEKSDDSEETWIDTIPDNEDHIENVNDKIYREELRAAIEKALDEIPARQALIVRRTELEQRSLVETGEEAGVSAAWVHQLRNKGLTALRNNRGLRAFLADHINYYRFVGTNQFNTTRMSSTELLALRRMELEKKYAMMRIERENDYLNRLSATVKTK